MNLTRMTPAKTVRSGSAVLLATILLLGRTSGVQAQAAPRPLPTWEAPQLLPSFPGRSRLAREPVPAIRPGVSLATRSHTETGLLVGAAVGVAATTLFLIGFCSDSDTVCGIDEVGRATLFIAVPAAAVGALIGSLIRTEE